MNIEKTPPAERLLVVINPANNSDIALERAIITSALRKQKPQMHLLFSADEDNLTLTGDNKKLLRDDEWLKSITHQLDSEQINYTFEFSWSKQWYASVLACADRYNPDLILIPDSSTGKKYVPFTNSKWAVLRKSLCPVMIVRPNASSHRKKVLAAVNIQNDSGEHIELNKKILTKGMAIANIYNAEFFVVNAYTDSLHYPNREKIINMTGLPSRNVHAEEGEPAEVISTYANRIEADIVIIGTKARSGGLSLMRGNISEKVLSKLNQDVITYS